MNWMFVAILFSITYFLFISGIAGQWVEWFSTIRMKALLISAFISLSISIAARYEIINFNLISPVLYLIIEFVFATSLLLVAVSITWYVLNFITNRRNANSWYTLIIILTPMYLLITFFSDSSCGGFFCLMSDQEGLILLGVALYSLSIIFYLIKGIYQNIKSR